MTEINTNIGNATKEELLRRAKECAKEAGFDYDVLSDTDKREWDIEATFTFSWLCE